MPHSVMMLITEYCVVVDVGTPTVGVTGGQLSKGEGTEVRQ